MQEVKTAPSPFALSRRSWRRVLMRTKDALERDNVPIVAAGCAFLTFLAIFPAILALVSIYGLIAEPSDILAHLNNLRGVLPDQAFSVIVSEAERLAAQPPATLTLSFAVTLLFAIWSAGRTARALMGALNIVYVEREKRNFVVLNLQVLGLTLAGLLGLVISLAAIAVVPTWLRLAGVGGIFEVAISLIRWPLLGVFVCVALTMLYRMAPSRSPPRWSWVGPGAILATLLWLLTSILFSVYVSYFGNFNATYGSFGALIILMIWLHLSFIIILMGGELNAELEHEVLPDTTTGKPQPLGYRGATMADRVAGRD